MKVFISWSGRRSNALANALKDWLPLILQYAKPWVSEKDISAGERWAQAIAGELESSNFGILCITPENIKSEWILFEAGALSKSMLDAKVIPLLFGLELSDLSGPLSQFQALKVDQQGMLSVAKAINEASDNKASNVTIEKLIPALWGEFQQKLDSIPNKELSEKNMRPQTEILEELVSQVRGLGTIMREFDIELMEKAALSANIIHRDSDPRMVNEMMHKMIRSSGTDMSLLLLAGFLRNRMPWLAEVMVEAHRDLKHATLEQARDIAKDLIEVVKLTTYDAWGERMMKGGKADHLFLMDLPILIERAISLKLENRDLADLI